MDDLYRVKQHLLSLSYQDLVHVQLSLECNPFPLSARDTVVTEYPLILAISRIVAILPTP